MHRTVYLDNAATTFPKPPEVLRSVYRLIKYHCANPGRSTHKMAAWCAERVYEAREAVASFINFDSPERVIFTSNATHALNLAIKGAIREKCHVIISDLEHNSVLRPLYNVSERLGLDISVFNSDRPLREAILPLVRDDTKYLISTLSSNVSGKVIDTEELSSIANELGLYSIVDASQLLGHRDFDVCKTPFDIICAPGHKALFGMQGGGIAVFNSKNSIAPLMEGGSGNDTFNFEMPVSMPERYEAGTLNMPAIVSLASGISYLENIGMSYVEEKLSTLTKRLNEVLDCIGAHIYGCENGIASFNLPNKSTADLTAYLDECGIATRGGFHCAPLIHEKLGTEVGGAVRASLSIFNSNEDLDALYKALKMII